MHFLAVFFLTVSANIDNLLLGLSYSMKNIKITNRSNFIIAILTTLGTYLSMKIGYYLTYLVSLKTANQMGATLLIIIGIIMIVQSFHNDDSQLITQNLSTKQTILLGLTLSFNNIGLSLGGSITGMPCFLTCFMTFLFSFLFIAIAQKLGQSSFFQYIQSYAPMLSSIIIIFLGIYEFMF